MSRFTDDVDKTIAKLEDRLDTPDPEARARLEDSLIECERIKKDSLPPTPSDPPFTALRRRHHAVQREHGLIDHDTP